jgi:hypothetical protein
MRIKNISKILIICAIFILISASLYNVSAIDSDTIVHGTFTNTHQFDEYNSSLNVGKTNSSNMIVHALQVILTLIRNFALGWAIIMSMVIAIKYMISTPQVRSQLKTDMPTYILGAVLLFGAAGLMKIIGLFVNDIF